MQLHDKLDLTHQLLCQKRFPFAQNCPKQRLGVKKPSVSDGDWPEECLLPRLICSYQDLTLASDELGDFVVRAGAGAGSPQMAGSEGEGWDVGVRRGRWNTFAFLPCKVSYTCVCFASLINSDFHGVMQIPSICASLSPRDRNCVGLHCLMLWGHWTTGRLVDSPWPPRNVFWEKNIGVFFLKFYGHWI